MLNRLFTLLLTFLIISPSVAQSPKDEIAADARLSGSNHLAYPGPRQQRLTPAPKGYRPFYISHYGRHGSRYLIGQDEYDVPVSILARADSLGKLTPLGRSALERARMLRDEAAGRLGELTPLGAEQHRQIARRMYERFPEVFAGGVTVDAKSTVVIRCILSMENELHELLRLNPKLDVRHDASQHDMYYMNLSDPALSAKKAPRRARVAWDEFCARHVSRAALMERLFNDAGYVKYEVDTLDLAARLFKLASNAQSSPLGAETPLYDIFTPDELYAFWLADNASWYIGYGACTLNGGTQPYSQRNLLRNIISQADSCIALERPGATLRFGHETMVLPLVCLLGIDGYGLATGDLESLVGKGWVNYRIFPMGANVQFVFYRRDKDDADVLVKVLLNENEATLPLPSDLAPYYRWSDFKRFYTDKLDAYHSLRELEVITRSAR